jgi:hypothetical protein
MRPAISRERRHGWLAFGLAVLVAGGTLGWLGLAIIRERDRQEVAARAFTQRQGPFPVSAEVSRRTKNIANLRAVIEEQKKQVGYRAVSPFILEAHPDRGYFVRVVYDQLRKEFVELSRRRNVDFEPDMGFDFPGDRPPPADEAPHWTVMMQLVSKAVFLALQTNFLEGEQGIRHIRIDPLENGRRVATGPAGRPPLLREYPFTMTVQGSLRDIQWLLHQLSADTPTAAHREFDQLLVTLTDKLRNVVPGLDVKTMERHGGSTGPLIIRGLTISSQNMKPLDQVSQLTAVIQLAGMDFLSSDERREQPAVLNTRRERHLVTSPIVRPR